LRATRQQKSSEQNGQQARRTLHTSEVQIDFSSDCFLFTAAFGIDALAVLGQLLSLPSQFVTRLPRMTYAFIAHLPAKIRPFFRGAILYLGTMAELAPRNA
jgi:hypothetical protein